MFIERHIDKRTGRVEYKVKESYRKNRKVV